MKLGAEAGVMEPQSNREARKGFLSGFTGTRNLFFFFFFTVGPCWLSILLLFFHLFLLVGG